jgi:anti-sigma factor (TIGR02949 family)
MECDQVVVRLWEYLDQELASEDAAEVRVHLSRCSHCYPLYCWDRELLDLLARVRHSCTTPPTLIRWARRLV